MLDVVFGCSRELSHRRKGGQNFGYGFVRVCCESVVVHECTHHVRPL